MKNVHRSRARWAVAAVAAATLVGGVGATSASAHPGKASRSAAADRSWSGHAHDPATRTASRPDPKFGPKQRVAAIRAAQAGARKLSRQLRMSSRQALLARDVTRDAGGAEHFRYERTYAGLPVIGGDFVLQRNARGAITGADFGTTPRSIALSGRALVASVAASRAPGKGARKVIYADQHEPTLAWRTRVTGRAKDGTPIDEWVFTDARTGKRLGVRTMIYEGDTGTGKTLYSGSIKIGTKRINSKTFRLTDTARGNHSTYDAGNKFIGDSKRGRLFSDANNIWGTNTTSSRQTVAADAQYGAAKTWDFYLNNFGRDGIDATGRGSYSRVHFGKSYANAFWSDACFCMTYGDGDATTRPLVSLDVAGHEMTHGVTANSAGLDYFGDAGGLNESTSDVMGTMVEFSGNQSKDPGDYLIGERVIKTSPHWLRRMDKPSADGYSLNCWTSKAGTYDPHFSSGIGNHAFFLMAMGSGKSSLNGVNYDSPTCDSSTITPIGRWAAARVWYRALTTYWVSTTTYPQAANGMVDAAKDLYGAGSSQCAGVVAAWNAVNVATTENCTDPTGSVSDPRNLLHDPSFEYFNGSWAESEQPNDFTLILTTAQTGVKAHKGQAFAWLGDEYDQTTGAPVASDDSISQQVTIPATGQTTLRYYLQAYTLEDSRNGPIDLFTVEINGTPIQTMSNVDADGYSDGYWLLRKINVPTSYNGQTVTLTFRSVNDDNLNNTGWLIDDVDLRQN